MPRQWYYSHNGRTYGPVSARQVKYLAATGGLQPEDLIWPEGADPGAASAAERALDFAALRRLAQEGRWRGPAAAPQPAGDDLSEWLGEIDLPFRDAEEARGPVPEWLRPAEAAPPSPPPTSAVPVAMPVAVPIGPSLLERIGIDPVTEKVVDWGKLKKWLQEQLSQRRGPN